MKLPQLTPSLREQLGAITVRRTVHADGTVSQREYKIFRVVGRNGEPSTVAVPIESVIMLHQLYKLSAKQMAQDFATAAQLVREAPPLAQHLYKSWSKLVRERAGRIMAHRQALEDDSSLEPTDEDIAFAQRNNSAWEN